MKIGITGGSGFIGSWVAQRAVEQGHQVVILDRTGYLGGMAGKLVEEKTGALFLGDVRDATAMAELAAHVDGIIHLAACLGTQETIRNPFPAAETNVMGGLNFLEACAQYDIPGVYIGVGNHWMDNSYSITKTTVERFVHMYNRERGTRVNIVRAVNAYGPGQSVAPPYGPAKVRKITPAFVCRALTGAPIEVYGDGKQVSDMVHVSDVATALIRALEAAAEGRVIPDPIEIGPAHHLTVNEVAEIVRQAAATWRGDNVMVHITHLPMRPGEVPGATVSADWTTLEPIGMSYRDLIGPEEGLAATVKWYAEHWLPDYLAVQKKLHVPAQRAGEAPLARPAGQVADAPEIGPDATVLQPRLEPLDPECRCSPDALVYCHAARCNGGANLVADAAPDFAASQAHGQDH